MTDVDISNVFSVIVVIEASTSQSITVSDIIISDVHDIHTNNVPHNTSDAEQNVEDSLNFEHTSCCGKEETATKTFTWERERRWEGPLYLCLMTHASLSAQS